MLEEERHLAILNTLSRTGFARVYELATETGASEATIRRDLEKLGAEGRLRRVRGGAKGTAGERDYGIPWEDSLAKRREINTPQKQRIAEKAASLCSSGNLVFIDAGSTTGCLSEYLKNVKLNVITNSYGLAGRLAGSGESTVMLSGGVLYADSEIILNPFDESFYENFEADIVFMGAGAITPHGIENRDIRVIQAQRAMLRRARKKVILADSEKFRQAAPIRLCALGDIDIIITDNKIPDSSAKMCRDAEVELITV